MRFTNYLLLSALCISLFGCEKPEPPPPPPPPPPTEEEVTAFFDAAVQGITMDVAAALENGMPANQKDSEGNTALIIAAFHGHVETMQTLLKAGTDVNHHGGTGITALMMACGPRPHGYPDAVRLLIANGAELDAVDENEHFTALMYAAVEGLEPVVDLLLEAGADPTIIDDDGETAADFARRTNSPGLANKLQALIDAKSYKNN